jgi:hypoxanthine phosphoribosyltransferase
MDRGLSADAHQEPAGAPGPGEQSAESTTPAVGPVFLDSDVIAARVQELGAEISRDYQDREILLVGLLKGSVFFLADLARAISVPLEIDFLSLSSYRKEHQQAGSKAIRFLKDLDQPVKDKNVIVVQDMIDSGLTLHYINRSLALRRPQTLEACILFDRPQLRLVDLEVRYRGFEVPDDFFVGYGFDYQQLFRNLPYVAYLKTEDYQPALF